MSEEELDELVGWLENVYKRHKEYEDKRAAEAITYLRAQIDHLTRVINTIGPRSP